MTADFRMKPEGKIERERALWEVEDVALWGVNENFVSKEVKAELF